MIRLLHVNVLLALVDAANVYLDRPHQWLAANESGFQWASCALTENGFCRILSSSLYPGAVTPATAAQMLSGLRQRLAGHVFWHCEISIADSSRFQWDLVQGARQLTDLYLVALAVQQRGRLATFDQRIRWTAVAEAGATTVEILKT